LFDRILERLGAGGGVFFSLGLNGLGGGGHRGYLLAGGDVGTKSGRALTAKSVTSGQGKIVHRTKPALSICATHHPGADVRRFGHLLFTLTKRSRRMLGTACGGATPARFLSSSVPV